MHDLKGYRLDSPPLADHRAAVDKIFCPSKYISINVTKNAMYNMYKDKYIHKCKIYISFKRQDTQTPLVWADMTEGLRVKIKHYPSGYTL